MQEIDFKAELEAMKNRLENESNEDAIMRLNRKIVANSFYPVYIPNIFYWNNMDDAMRVTEIGCKKMRELLEKFKEK